MNIGETYFEKLYNSTDYGVYMKTAFRGSEPARVAICSRKDDAEAICLAIEYAVKNGVIT